MAENPSLLPVARRAIVKSTLMVAYGLGGLRDFVPNIVCSKQCYKGINDRDTTRLSASTRLPADPDKKRSPSEEGLPVRFRKRLETTSDRKQEHTDR